MVDVNVYKLYSTCIKYLPSCRKKKKQSNVNRFIIFLREVERKWYKMGEKKQEIMWSWHSVHALINKGLLNKHDWGMFVFRCWFRDAGDVDEESILFSSTTEGQVSSFSLSASSAVLTRSGGCCENYRRRLSGRVHSLLKCVFKQKSGPPCVHWNRFRLLWSLILAPVFAKRNKIHSLSSFCAKIHSEVCLKMIWDRSRLQWSQRAGKSGKYFLDLTDEVSY